MENYIVGLCALGQMYFKIDMTMLGINWSEFADVYEKIEKNNRDKIDMFRTIFTNMDLISEFYDYCMRNRDVKEAGEKNDHGKTVAVVDRFFRNAEHFYKKYFDYHYHIDGKLNELVLENREGEKRILNISELYADFFLAYYREWLKANDQTRIEERNELENIKTKNDVMHQLRKNLLLPIDADVPELSVSDYLINRSAKNIKKNLDNLVHNIRRYFGIHVDEDIQKLNTEKLINYYGKILDYYVRNPELRVATILSEEYKQVVKQYRELIRK